MIKIIIPTPPIPQLHKRLRRLGPKKTITYNPQETKLEQAKKIIREQIQQKFEGPVLLHITFYMPIPRSLNKKVKEELKHENIGHDKKPHIDDLQKFVFDALKGILFQNGDQICYVSATKFYSANPRTEIKASIHDEQSIHFHRHIYTHIYANDKIKTFDEMLLEQKKIHGKLSQAFLMRKFKLTPKYALELEKKYEDKGGA